VANRHGNATSDETLAAVRDVRDNGTPVKEAAKKQGISDQTVYNRMKVENVSPPMPKPKSENSQKITLAVKDVLEKRRTMVAAAHFHGVSKFSIRSRMRGLQKKKESKKESQLKDVADLIPKKDASVKGESIFGLKRKLARAKEKIGKYILFLHGQLQERQDNCDYEGLRKLAALAVRSGLDEQDE